MVVHIAVTAGQLVEEFGSVGKVFHDLVFIGPLVLQQLIQFALGLALL